MTIEDKINRIKEVAEDNSYEVRESYSGRGMYGKSCYGIVCDSPEDIIAEVGITGAKIDNMGLDFIVYYPNVTVD